MAFPDDPDELDPPAADNVVPFPEAPKPEGLDPAVWGVALLKVTEAVEEIRTDLRDRRESEDAWRMGLAARLADPNIQLVHAHWQQTAAQVADHEARLGALETAPNPAPAQQIYVIQRTWWSERTWWEKGLVVMGVAAALYVTARVVAAAVVALAERVERKMAESNSDVVLAVQNGTAQVLTAAEAKAAGIRADMAYLPEQLAEARPSYVTNEHTHHHTPERVVEKVRTEKLPGTERVVEKQPIVHHHKTKIREKLRTVQLPGTERVVERQPIIQPTHHTASHTEHHTASHTEHHTERERIIQKPAKRAKARKPKPSTFAQLAEGWK